MMILEDISLYSENLHICCYSICSYKVYIHVCTKVTVLWLPLLINQLFGYIRLIVIKHHLEYNDCKKNNYMLMCIDWTICLCSWILEKKWRRCYNAQLERYTKVHYILDQVNTLKKDIVQRALKKITHFKIQDDVHVWSKYLIIWNATNKKFSLV